MERNYSITLSDGTVIKNLGLNGTNYISSTEINPDIFQRNCSPVIFNDGTNDDVHPHMELVQITIMAGEYWIVLRDIPPEELKLQTLIANVDYLSMMTDIPL